MTTFDPETEEKLRQGFKLLNRFMLLMWRLGLGPWLNLWPPVLGRYCVVAHTGRKTGRRRYTPVNYSEIDGEIYVTAGFGAIADWYRNLVANPMLEVWLPHGWWAGLAEEVIDPAKRITIMRQVIIDSGFAGRLFGVNAHELSDEELDKLTAEYKLLHIRRVTARTGRGGPGELSWVWPLATFLLLPLAFKKRKRSKKS